MMLLNALIYEAQQQEQARAARKMAAARLKQEALSIAMKAYGSKCMGVSVEVNTDTNELVAVMICKSSIPKVNRKRAKQ